MTDSASDYGASGAKPDFMFTDWERRVREVVREALRDPMLFPAEFRAWLPSHIQTSSVQIPMSQIVGNFLVADHVHKLGGDIHGRPGVVRVGVPPYDFVGLTYDGLLGKWISDPIFVGGLASGVVDGVSFGLTDLYGSTVTAYQSLATSPGGTKVIAPVGGGFLHAPLTDAGLKAQITYYVAARTTSNSLVTSLGFSDGDFNGSVSAFNSDASFELTFTSSSITLKSSDWLDLPGGFASSPKDVLFVQFAARIPSGSPSIEVEWVSIYVRYVSA